MELETLLRWRLANQHLTGPPVDVLRYVGEALAVQSQDPPTARWSIGLRTGAIEAEVCAQLDAGELVRAHVLRPTWHYVAAADLGWLQQLTGERVERGMAARHRQLGLSERVLDAGFGVLQRELAGRTALTRRQLQPMLPTTDAPPGQVVGHLLMVAELRGLVCSGPLIGGQHSYLLAADALPTPERPFDATERTAELVRRFFAHHGPASVRDLARWCVLSQTEIRRVLPELELASVELAGTELWFDPEQPKVLDDQRALGAFLLPTFDEAFLSYLTPNFPRSTGHPDGDRPPSFAEAGGGLVVHQLQSVGSWRRKWAGRKLLVTLTLDPELDAQARSEIAAQVAALADFAGAASNEIVDA